MHTYIALFLAPSAVLEEWSKKPQEERESAEKKMREEWDTWMSSHAGMITETKAGGKTKRVTSDGVTDTKNDIMLYSIITASSHEEAASAFEGHPHLGIPQASIEVMEIRTM